MNDRYSYFSGLQIDVHQALSSFLDKLNDKDAGSTLAHSERVCHIASGIAEVMHLEAVQIEQLRQAALLHDVGKIDIADAVLLKPGALSRDEFQLMRQHTVLGERMLQGYVDQAVTDVVRAHHERWDGSGYPDGLAGEAIPLPARILAVADSFDAMVSHRVYRQGQEVAQVVAEIVRYRGSLYDPAVVDAFLIWQSQGSAALAIC